jgi:hypothetical protein
MAPVSFQLQPDSGKSAIVTVTEDVNFAPSVCVHPLCCIHEFLHWGKLCAGQHLKIASVIFLRMRPGSLLIIGVTMDYTVELVAQAIYEAEQTAYRWDDEPAIRKERFREYARNAINLLGEDIGVLLFALKETAVDVSLGGPRAAA